MFLVAICIAMLIAPGCDNTVDPFIERRAENPFFVHGFLDSARDTQFVRVAAISRSYDEPPAAIDAVVSTIEIGSGRVVEWRDSIVTLDDGATGHLFFALFRPAPGTSYELEVERSDGAITSATTTVPARPPVMVDDARTTTQTITQSVTWAGVDAPPSAAEVVYYVAPSSAEEPREFVLDYANSGELNDEGWTTDIDLSDAAQIIVQQIGSSGDPEPPVFYGIEMRLTLVSDEYLARDGTHVENGVGFFGAVGRFDENWELPAFIVTRLGFQDGQ